MNDFTKKELIAFEDAMQHRLELHKPQSGASPLLDKIQSMIDNYCEHQFREYLSGVTAIRFCTKCNKEIL